ncbi:MAG: YbbR-like domain-containing protein [Suipraeoptans sp.]
MKEKLLSNFGLKILAFVSAILLWAFVVNINDPEVSQSFSNVQVQIVNEDILTQTEKTMQVPDTDTVTVTVTAKRSVIRQLDAEKIVATADLKDITMGTLIPIKISIPGYENRYSTATSNPVNLEVQIDDEAKASFPITPVDKGTVRDGNVLSEMKSNPESVVIYGPKSIIDNISRVTAEVNVAGLSEDSTLESDLVIYDKNDNTVSQTMLRFNIGEEGLSVNVKLLKVKKVSLNFDDSLISAADGYVYSGISYEPKEIEIKGKKEDLSGISDIDIPATALEARNLDKKTDKTINIAEYLPDSIELFDQNAGTIVVTLNIDTPGVNTFEVATNSIVVKNLDDKLETSFDTAVDIEIQLQGEESVLDVLSLANKVSIDLKDYTEPGTYTVPVSVELPSGVKLVNSLEIKVILKQKSDGG